MKKKQTLYSNKECNFKDTTIKIKDLQIQLLEQQDVFIRPHLRQVLA
tara:strand:+ start:71 stop:211 length:141 start_codon:yes stop_codon:yes gene_type:complete